MNKLRILVTCFLSAILLSTVGCGSKDPAETYQAGLDALDRSDYSGAAKLFSRALKNHESASASAPVFNDLGFALWNQDRFEEAEDAFRSSLKLDPSAFDSSYNLGVLLCESGQIEDGMGFLADAAQMEGPRSTALEYLAHTLTKNDKWSQAAEVLDQALTVNPDSPRLLSFRALVSLQNEGTVAANGFLKKALEKDPDYGAALYNMAVVNENWVNDPVEARALYQKYARLHPGSRHAKSARSALDRIDQAAAPAPTPTPAVSTTVATTPAVTPEVKPSAQTVKVTDVPPVKNGETPAALPPPGPTAVPIPLHANTPAKARPDPSQSLAARNRSVLESLEEARQQIQSGDSGSALNLCLQAAAVASRTNRPDLEEKALRTAVALCNDQPRAHFAMGRFLNDQGRFADAMASFKQAATIEPTWSRALLSQASAAIACDEYQGALDALRQAVNVDPENPDALWALALFYDTQLNLHESAKRSFLKFVNAFPDDSRTADANTRLKALSEATKDSVRSRPGLQQAKNLHHRSMNRPDSTNTVSNASATIQIVGQGSAPLTLTPRAGILSTPEARKAQAVRYFNQGAVLQSRGDFEQAMRYYQLATQADPNYAPAYYNQGLIYQKSKQTVDARTAYMQALEMDPDMLNARYNLALVHNSLGDTEEAIRELNTLIDVNPNHALSHLVLGQIHEKQTGKFELARVHYTLFLELAPNDPTAPGVRRWLAAN